MTKQEIRDWRHHNWGFAPYGSSDRRVHLTDDDLDALLDKFQDFIAAQRDQEHARPTHNPCGNAPEYEQRAVNGNLTPTVPSRK